MRSGESQVRGMLSVSDGAASGSYRQKTDGCDGRHDDDDDEDEAAAAATTTHSTSAGRTDGPTDRRTASANNVIALTTV